MTDQIRTAIVHGADANHVAAYLPANYEVVREGEQQPLGHDGGVLIAGHDNAGWTLDDYVLPRLASGLMFGSEVFGVCIVNGAVDQFIYDDCTCPTCRRMQREALDGLL